MSGARTLAGTLALVMLVSTGCASMKGMRLPWKKRAERVDEVEELRQRVTDLQQRATMAEVELERLRRQVAELEETDLRADAKPLVSPVETPREVVIEEIEPVAEMPSNARPARIEVLDLESESMPETADGSISAVSSKGQALYDRGYTLFHQGRYLDAETTFQRFLSSFSSTDLGDNAQFWIGESRYARRDFSGALAAFREVVSLFPSGNKVPDSLLKAADCLAALGDLDAARQGYEEVVRDYPATAAAAVAEDRMRELE